MTGPSKDVERYRSFLEDERNSALLYRALSENEDNPKLAEVYQRMAASEEGQRALILFGLDKPSENDAERALLASLEAVRRLKAFSSPLGQQLSTRIAVNTGTHWGSLRQNVIEDRIEGFGSLLAKF